jgi:anti-anti-sigma regulatory factor
MQQPRKTVQYEVKEQVIGGRDQGRAERSAVLDAIEASGPDAVIKISFKQVEVLDFSAADELIAVLVRRVVSGELGGRRFVLTNMTEPVRESVTAVLSLRGMLCFEMREDLSWRVLGTISQPLLETLQFVNEAGRVTSKELTDRLSTAQKFIEPSAAANRLKSLAEAGLIVEDPTTSGGRGVRRAYYSIPSLYEGAGSDAGKDNP